MTPVLPYGLRQTGNPPRTAEAALPASSGLQVIGNWFLLGYLFIALSRVLDVTVQVRAAAVLYGGIILATLMFGGIFTLFRTKVGLTMFFLIAWLAITVPFSTWPGGSTPYFLESLKAFMLGVAILAIPRTVPETTRLMKVMALSILAAAGLAWVYGRVEYGRLMLAAGTYSDPNQFAMTLLMAMPLWVIIGKQARSKPMKFLAYACVIPILITFLRTGSRGGLIGLAIMLVFAFFQVPAKAKLILVTTLVLGALGSFLVLPSYLRARYFTIFSASEGSESLSAEEQSQLYGADIGSSYGRFTLLKDSLHMTITHPVTGLGLGQFRIKNWERRNLMGKPGPTMVTHNAYTEFSSEGGIPAFALFIALLYQCYRSIGSTAKLGQSLRLPELSSSVEALRLSLIVLTVCSFFLSVAYSQLFYIMAGIIARFYLTTEAVVQAGYQNTLGTPAPVPSSRGPQRPQGPLLSPPARPARAPRNRLSPWRTPSQNVRNSRLS